MLTRNKKLKDYGIPAEDIEKLNAIMFSPPYMVLEVVAMQ